MGEGQEQWFIVAALHISRRAVKHFTHKHSQPDGVQASRPTRAYSRLLFGLNLNVPRSSGVLVNILIFRMDLQTRCVKIEKQLNRDFNTFRNKTKQSQSGFVKLEALLYIGKRFLLVLFKIKGVIPPPHVVCGHFGMSHNTSCTVNWIPTIAHSP